MTALLPMADAVDCWGSAIDSLVIPLFSFSAVGVEEAEIIHYWLIETFTYM